MYEVKRQPGGRLQKPTAEISQLKDFVGKGRIRPVLLIQEYGCTPPEKLDKILDAHELAADRPKPLNFTSPGTHAGKNISFDDYTPVDRI